MADPEQHANQPGEGRGSAILMSYRELVEIRTQQATILGKLDAALMLQGKVDRIDHRLLQVELVLAGKAGATKTWHIILGFLGGVLTTALAGLAEVIIPRLIGGH